jgi:predicted membrane channel-forming protein YqfA (hemolysin III family)
MSAEGFLYMVVSLFCIGLAIGHSISGERHLVSHQERTGHQPAETSEQLAMQRVRAVWHLVSILLLAIGVLFFLMAQKPLSTPMVSGLLTAIFLGGAIEVFAVSRTYYALWVTLAVSGAISWLATVLFVQQIGPPLF